MDTTEEKKVNVDSVWGQKHQVTVGKGSWQKNSNLNSKKQKQKNPRSDMLPSWQDVNSNLMAT